MLSPHYLGLPDIYSKFFQKYLVTLFIAAKITFSDLGRLQPLQIGYPWSPV